MRVETIKTTVITMEDGDRAYQLRDALNDLDTDSRIEGEVMVIRTYPTREGCP